MNLKKYLVGIVLITSCKSNYNIPNKDKQLIPYKGAEILIFKSNKGNSDTIFLQGYNEFSSPIKQWSFPLKNVEHRILLSRRTDPNYDRYLDSLDFVTLINDGTTKITINLTAKHSWFLGYHTFTKSAFLHLKDTIIRIDGTIYRDVLVIRTDPDAQKDRVGQKFHSVVTMYWSKTKGLIRFDDANSENWELVKVL